jgi:hypothetical protein
MQERISFFYIERHSIFMKRLKPKLPTLVGQNYGSLQDAKGKHPAA